MSSLIPSLLEGLDQLWLHPKDVMSAGTSETSRDDMKKENNFKKGKNT